MYESRDEREIKRRQRRRQRQHHRVTETRCALWNWNIVRHMGDATSHVNRMTTTTSSTTLLCRRATARVNVCACYLFVVGIFFFRFASILLFFLLLLLHISTWFDVLPLHSRRRCRVRSFGFSLLLLLRVLLPFFLSLCVCPLRQSFLMKFKCRQVVAYSLSISDFDSVRRARAHTHLASVCVCVCVRSAATTNALPSFIN